MTNRIKRVKQEGKELKAITNWLPYGAIGYVRGKDIINVKFVRATTL